MKRILILLLSMISCNVTYGQINYYEGKDTLHIGNEVYKIDFDYLSSKFMFSNANNDKIDQPIKYTDGSPVPVGQVFYKIENNGDNTGVWRAARETFTPEEIASLYDEFINVRYYMKPDGTITDVFFTIPKKSIFFSIPPERWAVLEKKIKEYQKFQLSGAEKYQYIGMLGFLHFNRIYNE